MPLPMPSILYRAKTKQVHCACCKLPLSLFDTHTHRHAHPHSLFLKLSPSLIHKLSHTLSIATRNRPTVGASNFLWSFCLISLFLFLSLPLTLIRLEPSSCLSKTEAPSCGVSGPQSIFSLHPIFLNLLSQSMPCTGRLGKMYC